MLRGPRRSQCACDCEEVSTPSCVHFCDSTRSGSMRRSRRVSQNASNNEEAIMSVKPIPEGHHTITAQLSVERAAEAIEFYKKAFGAEEVTRAIDPGGKKVWHAALRIGSSVLF